MNIQDKIEAAVERSKVYENRNLPVMAGDEQDQVDALEIALADLDEQTQRKIIARCYLRYGFQIYGTGGGCEAFMEEDNFDSELPYTMTTSSGDPSIPDMIDEEVYIGVYWNDIKGLTDELMVSYEGGQMAEDDDGDPIGYDAKNWIYALAWHAQDWMILSVIQQEMIQQQAGSAIVSKACLTNILSDFAEVWMDGCLNPDDHRFSWHHQLSDDKQRLTIMFKGPMMDQEFRTLSAWTIQQDGMLLTLVHHCPSGSETIVGQYELKEMTDHDSSPAYEAMEEILRNAQDAIIAGKISHRQQQEKMTLSDPDFCEQQFDVAVMDCFRRLTKEERDIHLANPSKIDGMLSFGFKQLIAKEWRFRLVMDCQPCDMEREREQGPSGDSSSVWMIHAERVEGGWLEGRSFILQEDANEVCASDLSEWIYETMSAWRIAKHLLATVFASLKHAGGLDFLPSPAGREWIMTTDKTTLNAVWINDDSFRHSLLLSGRSEMSDIRLSQTIRIRQGLAADVCQDVMKFHQTLNR